MFSGGWPSQRRGTAALAAWGIGSYEWGAPGHFLADSRCLEMYGWSGRPPKCIHELWEVVHPDDRDRTRAAFEAAAGGAGEVDFVHRVMLRGGELEWLRHRLQNGSPLVDEASRAPLVIGSVMNVTEQVSVEQELGRTQSRFEEAVRGAQFGIFDHNHVDDPGAQRVYWSPRLREIFGVDAEEPSSIATMLSRIPAEEHEALSRAVARAHDPSGDGYYDVEHRYLHPKDGLRWLLTRSSTRFGEVGGKHVPLRTVGAIVDVTARRKSEQENEQRARMLDATIDFVAMFEPGGALSYLNRAGRDFLGLGEGEAAVGRSVYGHYDAGSLKRLLEEGLPAAELDGAWRSELEFIRHDGTLVPMSHVLLSHRTLDGQSLIFSVIARDISRERQLEATIRQSQKMEAIGRLAGGIAHDFNNVLCAILSFSHLAREAVGSGGKGREELEEIIRATERAAGFTQQLLAFGRRQVLRPRVVDVGLILQRISPMIRRLVGEDIELELDLAPGSLHVKVDPTHLEQVVLNLAVNARDAMPRGGRLRIESRLEAVDVEAGVSRLDLGPGSYAVIAVSDEGSGMDDATRARVFEPFFSTKPVGRGTGLGLATVFGIVKQSGGSVVVSSEVGRGSTFEAYVPTTDEPLTEAAALRPKPRAVNGAVVLLAEDDPGVRRALATVLQRAGHTVLEAENVWRALELAASFPGRIDLLLTDVVMPVMSGKELADRLTAQRPELGVLYMSGYTDRAIVHAGVLDAGVHLLAKPITPEELLTAVGEVLEAQHRTGE